jgi:hypothetical protein
MIMVRASMHPQIVISSLADFSQKFCSFQKLAPGTQITLLKGETIPVDSDAQVQHLKVEKNKWLQVAPEDGIDVGTFLDNYVAAALGGLQAIKAFKLVLTDAAGEIYPRQTMLSKIRSDAIDRPVKSIKRSSVRPKKTSVSSNTSDSATSLNGNEKPRDITPTFLLSSVPVESIEADDVVSLESEIPGESVLDAIEDITEEKADQFSDDMEQTPENAPFMNSRTSIESIPEDKDRVQ